MSTDLILQIRKFLASEKDPKKRRHALEDAITECNRRMLDEKYPDLWMYGDEPWNYFTSLD